MRRAATIACCLALVAACGSRVDDAGGDGGGSGLGGPTTSSATSVLDDAVPTPESDTLVTMENPCGPGPLEGSTPPDADGVTDEAIRIGVISDRANDVVPLPTVGIEESVEAFVAFCNAAGGINGRELVLETYDSKISALEAATTEACRSDLLALVGTGSVQDQQAISTREDCGLVEIAGYTATAERASADLLYQPVPGQSTGVDTGPCKHIAAEAPDAVTRAAMVYSDLPAAADRAEALIDACEAEAGFDFVVSHGQAFGDNDFRSVVADMKAKDVGYLTLVTSAAELFGLLNEVETQDLDIEVLDLGQQYYDPAVAAEPLADGAWIVTGTAPFAETATTPMLGLYQQWLDTVTDEPDRATALGAQSFSAGFLFATAAKAAGAELTRETLVEQLEQITSWDGGGLHGTTDPSGRDGAGCYVYLRLLDGEFVREHPADGFECDTANIVPT